MIQRMYPIRKVSRSEFVPIRQLRYHVRQWGTPNNNTPPLVMVHGWMDVSASFQFVVDALAKDLFLKLVVVTPSQRYYASQVLAHPFITQTSGGIPLTHNQLNKAMVAQKNLRTGLQLLLFLEMTRLNEKTSEKNPRNQKEIAKIICQKSSE